jgi:Cu/Ag efflux protein CusF
MKKIPILAACLMLGASLALGACGGGESGSTGSAEGVVLGVDREQAQVTLDHGEISGLMGAMTMTYDVADPALLEGLADGDEVAFVVRESDGVYTVTEIEAR